MLRMPIFRLLFCRVESMQMTVLYSNRGIRPVRRVQHPMFFVEGMHRKMIPSRMSKSRSPVPTVIPLVANGQVLRNQGTSCKD